MIGSPLVSIIIPCYNQAHFLNEAIESALRQNYPHLDVIVVDDGSTDNTSDVAAQYSTVRCIRQANQGLSAARNTGIHHSRGQYHIFLDADDRLLPQAVEHSLDCFNTHPNSAFVFGHYHLISEDGRKLRTRRERCFCSDYYYVSGTYQLIEGDGSIRATRHDPRQECDHYAALLQRNHITMHATVMYCRTVFKNIGGFDTTLSACEDYDLYLRVARQYPIACHDHVVAEYRRHGTNMTRKSVRMVNAALTVLRAQWPYVAGNEYYETAYRAGVDFWQGYYGQQAIFEIPFYLRNGSWQDIRQTTALAWYYIRQKQAWLENKISRRLTALKHRLHAPPVHRVDFGQLRQTIPLNETVQMNSSQTIDDYYIESFLSAYTSEIQGDVLEMGDNCYAKKYGAEKISQYDTLTVPNGDEDAVLEQVADFPANGFDCIILPQALHLVYHAKSFLEAIYRLLKPGGVLLATLPGIGPLQSQDQANRQYWAFTTQVARRLFAEIFTPINVRAQAFGNVLAATALLQGVPVGALQPHELDHQDDQYQVLVAVRAVKPTHS